MKSEVKVIQSCPTLRPHGLDSPLSSPGQNTAVGSLSLLQEIFPTQKSNPGLPHCRWILYQLSYQGNPRKLEWVAYPFSNGSSRTKNRTGVSCIAGRCFTSWAIRESWGNSSLWFGSAFLWALVILSIFFMYLLAVWMSSLEKCLSPLSIFN